MKEQKKEKFALLMFQDRTFSKVHVSEIEDLLAENPGTQVVSWIIPSSDFSR